MKKFSAILIALLLSACVLCGCTGTPTGGNKTLQPAVSAEEVDANLQYFLGITDEEGNVVHPDGNMGDRTPTSESERKAAERLYARFSDRQRYAHLAVTPLDSLLFDVATDRTSQNVEVRWANPAGVGKQIVVGTGYDSSYGDYKLEYTGQSSTGAFANATGVATVMTLIDYCDAHHEELAAAIDFDIVFVFFGSSSVNSAGSVAYIKNGMTATQRLNTLMMFDVERFGGDRVYLYADEVQTEQEKFLRRAADSCGAQFYDLPDNMPLIEGIYIDDVYYTHFGMLGDQAPFTEWKIPSAHIFSGFYGGFNLSDLERKGQQNIGGTVNDTYANLKKDRGDYGKQGSEAITFLLQAVTTEGFAAAAESGREKMGSYAFWTNPLWAHLIVIFIIIALGIVLIILVKVFEKKYPYKPVVKRMKIAVFGMDYETKTDEDIFVDIKRPRNPFDGY